MFYQRKYPLPLSIVISPTIHHPLTPTTPTPPKPSFNTFARRRPARKLVLQRRRRRPVQLQNALREFDFLQQHESSPGREQHQSEVASQFASQSHRNGTAEGEDDLDYNVPPPPLPDTPPATVPNNTAAAAALQKSLSGDLLRPVLSMPPVVLMGGGGGSNRNSYISYSTASPIVEEPPSPAPNVEFPFDDYDAYSVTAVSESGVGTTYDEIIEVRFLRKACGSYK